MIPSLCPFTQRPSRTLGVAAAIFGGSPEELFFDDKNVAEAVTLLVMGKSIARTSAPHFESKDSFQEHGGSCVAHREGERESSEIAGRNCVQSNFN